MSKTIAALILVVALSGVAAIMEVHGRMAVRNAGAPAPVGEGAPVMTPATPPAAGPATPAPRPAGQWIG